MGIGRSFEPPKIAYAKAAFRDTDLAKVYPDVVEFREQKMAHVDAEDFDTALTCPACGQNNVMTTPPVNDRIIVTVTPEGQLNLTPQPILPVGTKIKYFDDPDSPLGGGLFDFFEEEMHYDPPQCPNCGERLILTSFLNEESIHGPCPGCPFCDRYPVRSSVLMFCIDEVFMGKCTPESEECKSCNAWYGRVATGIDAPDILEVLDEIRFGDAEVAEEALEQARKEPLDE